MAELDQKTLQAIHHTWPIRLLPDAAKPFAELMRLHRPAGIMMFYLPCFYGTFLVGALGHRITAGEMVLANLRLILLSFSSRGTLCTWNDVIDRDIDQKVLRTRIRPVARGSVTVAGGLIWTLIQASVTLTIYAAILPQQCILISLPFIALHISYPFMKRLTSHPQIVLGLALAQGLFLAFPALDRPLPSLLFLVRSPPLVTAESATQAATDSTCLLAFSAAYVFWTVVNDTIYAAQDAEDDVKAGVGSPVIFWRESVRNFLRVNGLMQVICLFIVARAMRHEAQAPAQGLLYAALAGGGTLLGLFTMIERVDLKDPVNCGWWFNTGNVLVGCVMAAGLMAEYVAGLLC